MQHNDPLLAGRLQHLVDGLGVDELGRRRVLGSSGELLRGVNLLLEPRRLVVVLALDGGLQRQPRDGQRIEVAVLTACCTGPT